MENVKIEKVIKQETIETKSIAAESADKKRIDELLSKKVEPQTVHIVNHKVKSRSR